MVLEVIWMLFMLFCCLDYTNSGAWGWYTHLEQDKVHTSRFLNFKTIVVMERWSGMFALWEMQTGVIQIIGIWHCLRRSGPKLPCAWLWLNASKSGSMLEATPRRTGGAKIDSFSRAGICWGNGKRFFGFPHYNTGRSRCDLVSHGCLIWKNSIGDKAFTLSRFFFSSNSSILATYSLGKSFKVQNLKASFVHK